MTKQITVARALKEKNRLIGKLAQARNLIVRENSHEKGVPRGVDVRTVSKEAADLQKRLVAIKTAIAVANREIVGKLVELNETKSEIAWLNGLSTKEGSFARSSFGNSAVDEYEAEIKQAEVLERLKALQKKAERLQDELDEFNAATKVEVELED